ncbi:LacI family DNA-binding transcriptional regulator [Oleiharenicola lentus]|uniref:LacI family DNA-binding transcriptional regulator n=1 Tax=Oleiharenicola lentus TaxID=2508720 RepID=UPI003F66BCC6
MPTQTTLEDVAKRAGVHRSTVSLALRNSPRITADVRARIQALAREMRYRVNPLVATLMRSRRSGHAVKHVSIAYVTNYPARYGWRPPHHDRPDFFPGAQKRAMELGYKLEHFWLAEPGMTPARMSDILSERAINGVLLGRLPPGQSQLELLWERFSSVALGFTLKSPALHHVVEDPFSAGTQTVEQCLARGYRRLGFVFADADDSPGTGDRFLGAFMRQQFRLPAKDRIPPCEYQSGPGFRKNFLAWLQRWRPDALVATHGQPIHDWLRAAGYSVPGDIGLATLINDHLDEKIAGVHNDPYVLGSLATDMVVGMLHRGELGLPPEPHFVLTPGIWKEGSTLRASASAKTV